MNRTLVITILLAFTLVVGCAKVTTASEPQFDSISKEKATTADFDLYSTLTAQKTVPADRVKLAIAIENLDPATLPVPPTQPLHTYQVGDLRTFWTHNNDTFEFNQITARLMEISKHAYFWQDVASQPLNAAGELATQEDWTAAGDSFDNTYECVRAVFGHEESPGLDGDARLFVVHSDTLGRVGGYFGQTDLLPAIVEPHSNEGQYFFISNTWSSGIASDYYKEVLAHEFQHMIQKNMDPNEEGWLNEGMSMFAQQVAGMRGDNSVAEYLLKSDQSLWYWDSKPSDYGQSFLFVEYLYEQMGSDFIKALAADPDNGLASIDKQLVKFKSSKTADDLYADAVTAAFFNDTTMASGEFVFHIPVLPVVQPRYKFTSLPAVYQGTVQQYGGVDFIAFTGDGEATISFTGDQVVKLIPAEAHSGENFWWSSRYDSTFGTLTREVDLTGTTTATLKYWAWYDIEEDWDYAYLLVSTDNGLHWTLIPSTSSRESNPNDQNLGYGISGKSGGGFDPIWIQETADLSTYAGQHFLLRFAMQNDLVVNYYGFAVDDLTIPEIGWVDDVEDGTSDWVPDGFVLTHNRIPQVWRIRAVEHHMDNSIIVHDLVVNKGAAKLKINFGDLKQLVVFVIGQTRFTTIPASYSLKISH